MTNHDDIVSSWLQGGPDQGTPTGPEKAFERLPAVRQRAAWVVALSGGTMGDRPSPRRLQVRAAALVTAIAVLAGGAFLSERFAVLPPGSTSQPSSSQNASVRPPATESPALGQTNLVSLETVLTPRGQGDCATLHPVCATRWVTVSNADGTEERRLFPDGSPMQSVVASPDGSRLIVSGIFPADDDDTGSPEYYVTDLAGASSTRLDTDCSDPCWDDTGFSFSPDGSTLAFVRSLRDPEGITAGTYVIALMNVDTGVVTELNSTLTADANGTSCVISACVDGLLRGVSWSPDGRYLLVTRFIMGRLSQSDGTVVKTSKIYIVGVDGSEFRAVLPPDAYGAAIAWSPNGERILLADNPDFAQTGDDLFTVRLDGSGLTRLASSGAAVSSEPGYLSTASAGWMPNGRVVFARSQTDDPLSPRWQFWTVEPDGGDLGLLADPDAATMRGFGCTDCPYLFADGGVPDVRFGYWRAAP